jgi:hypothetical protein
MHWTGSAAAAAAADTRAATMLLAAVLMLQAATSLIDSAPWVSLDGSQVSDGAAVDGDTAASADGVACNARWLPPGSPLVSHVPNVLMIGDSISKGNSGYSLYVRDILQTVEPSGLRGTSDSLIGTVQHGGGFGSDGQAAASQQGAAKVACYMGNASGSLESKAWSTITYNAGLHDCGRGSSEWVNASAYEANLRAIFSTLIPAARAVIFVATTPFDLKLPINYTVGITPQCVVQRNQIAKRVAGEMGVVFNDLASFVDEGCLRKNYTQCAWQTTGLHFFTRAPLPSGQQYTAISVANAIVRSLTAADLAPPAPPGLPLLMGPREQPCGAALPPETKTTFCKCESVSAGGLDCLHSGVACINDAIPQILFIGDEAAAGYGGHLQRIFESPLPWCGRNQSIPNSEPADATGFCGKGTGRAGPIRPLDMDSRTATGALATVVGRSSASGSAASGVECAAHQWLSSTRKWDVIALSSFGWSDCANGSSLNVTGFENSLRHIMDAAAQSLNGGGKIVWIPSTLAGAGSAASASNACISEQNAIGRRLVSGSKKLNAVAVDLDTALQDACGGHGYKSCSLQRLEDGSLSESGKAFSAVIVAHAIAPLLGPRWEAVYRQVAPSGQKQWHRQ